MHAEDAPSNRERGTHRSRGVTVRYVIYGVGAIGGTIGGRLVEAGHDVTLIARGAHLEEMQRTGLRLMRPDADLTYEVHAVAGPEQADVGPDDIVVLAMKTQDTEAAIERLAGTARHGARIVCAQNGVESERIALRRFRDVYAMCVMLPADHLEPGVVRCYGSPRSGILDLGRFPGGIDETAEAIAADLDGCGFSSRAIPDAMRIKYGKLMLNLHNAIDALGGPRALETDLATRARAEAADVLKAAGIAYASSEEDAERRAGLLERKPVAGEGRAGGSTWQSIARGTGSIETDFLNGEITLLGRLHGIPTPVNAAIQRVTRSAVSDGVQAGGIGSEELVARVAAEVAGG